MKECKRCGLTCNMYERDKHFYRAGLTKDGSRKYASYCKSCHIALGYIYRERKRNQEVVEDTARLTRPAIVRTGWPFTA